MYQGIPLFRSLRFRLIASVVIIEIIMLFLLVWSNVRIVQTTHTNRLKETAENMLLQIANTSGRYMVAVDYAALEEYLSNSMGHGELSYIVVLDRDNFPVIELGDVPEDEWPNADTHPAEVDDRIFDLSKDISIAGLPVGRVLMGFSLSLMDQAIKKSRNRGMTIAITEILLTVLVTVLIGVHLTRRLGVLARAAQDVGSGNYKVVVSQEPADEVGMTAMAFNKMVEEVSRRMKENKMLVQKSLHIQEAERQELARELHDELGQCITAIRADAESIRDLSKKRGPGVCDSRVETSASAILSVSSRIYDVVHSMMQRLRPPVLDHLGLNEALSEEVEAWQTRHPEIKCVFDSSGDLSGLSDQIKITLYRIVQESLTNITKHALAKNVTISISLINATDDHSDKCSHAEARLTITDDGCGIDMSIRGSGLGLTGMRERVDSLEGEFQIDTVVDKYTSIIVSIPVNIAMREL